MLLPVRVLGFLMLPTFLVPTDCAKILGFFPIPSYSHQVVYKIYMEELARRGHNVTIITPNPSKKVLPNYTEIDVSAGYELMHKDLDIASDAGYYIRHFPEALMAFFISKMPEFCDLYLSNPDIYRIIKDNEQFDAFIVEYLPLMCILPFSLQSKNITIGISSAGQPAFVHSLLGSTSNLAHIPDIMFPYFQQLTFLQRLRLSIFNIFMKFLMLILSNGQQKVSEFYFGPNIPSISDMATNVDLIMPHTHFTYIPRPNAQSIVDIGGPPLHLHGYIPQTLPKDLQEFLDSATDGVIYFSLGSNVKSSTMPESKRALFLNAFRQIKQKVLWKWETDDLPGKPDNVKVQKWLPQTDVLAHPNIKAFISQGGLQSMGESTHFTVPMVVIPFFADQELNAKKLESVGVAIRLDFETMTTEEILFAISEVANNPKYKENMVKYSALTRDQPQTPMDRAVWWTEYVLRHNGAKHLRSSAVDLPWYQYFLLDVIGFLLLVLFSVLYIMHFIGSRLYRKFFKSKAKKE